MDNLQSLHSNSPDNLPVRLRRGISSFHNALIDFKKMKYHLLIVKISILQLLTRMSRNKFGSREARWRTVHSMQRILAVLIESNVVKPHFCR
jgi:hypothetical protein